MQEWWERHRLTAGVGVAGLVLGAALTLVLARPDPPPLRVIQPTSVPTPSHVVVHVSGAVNSPGVYRLPATARVVEAVEAAGGATDDGNPHGLNLAARVRDGQLILVPGHDLNGLAGISSSDQAAPDGSEPRRIDLNRADEAQLDTLPGIGSVIARRILEHRAREGAFERVEQLLEARLVNSATFERIKDLVEVR